MFGLPESGEAIGCLHGWPERCSAGKEDVRVTESHTGPSRAVDFRGQGPIWNFFSITR